MLDKNRYLFPYKGIFWFVYEDESEINKNSEFCFKIPSDVNGYPIENDLDLNAKSGLTYNHQKYWNENLGKPFNKSFNYYGRGRVEISNGTAKIYINGNFVDDMYIDFLKNEFNLSIKTGVKQVKVIVDGSDHYKCHLDGGWRVR